MIKKIFSTLFFVLIISSLCFGGNTTTQISSGQPASLTNFFIQSYTTILQNLLPNQNSSTPTITNVCPPNNNNSDGGSNLDFRRNHRIKKKITGEKKNSTGTYK